MISSNPTSPRQLGLATGTFLVIASMIGTGIFTTTGLLLEDIDSPIVLLGVWLLGGVFAFCGAACYGELGTLFPQNGGEYVLLSRVYHPAVGFIAGCISFVVGFSAPIAATALAFGYYMVAIFPNIPPLVSAWVLVVSLSVLHAFFSKLAIGTQNAFTLVKLTLIALFIVGGAFLGNHSASLESPLFTTQARTTWSSPSVAVGLIVVSFAYSGWNAAIYIAGELRHPKRTIPLALLFGTVLVTLLYLGINLIYLIAAPLIELRGVVEVGHVAAVRLFGPYAGRALSAVIAVGLISTVGAMIISGPRIYEAMGQHYPALRFLAARTEKGGPLMAIALQASVSLLMIVTSSFDVLLTYVGFTLSLVSTLTVFGVIVLRFKHPKLLRSYHTWGYPFTPLLFVGATTWIILRTVLERPAVATSALVTIAVGFILWLLVRVPKNLYVETAGITNRNSAPPEG